MSLAEEMLKDYYSVDGTGPCECGGGIECPNCQYRSSVKIVNEAIERCAQQAEKQSVAELRTFGGGELRRFSGKFVRDAIVAKLRALKEQP